MKFLYHIPSLNAISAARTYYHGYKNAILDMKHEFRAYTVDDNLKKLLEEYEPDIFITSLNPYSLKYIDIPLLKYHKKKGMVVFVNVPFWKSPMSKLRINEAPSLSQ